MAIICACFYVVFLAILIGNDKFLAAILITVIAVTPLLIYVALRQPMLFPFGIYVASIPIDPLFTNSGGFGAIAGRCIGGAALIALLIRAIRVRRFNVPPTFWFAWAAYVLWCNIGMLWALDPQATTASVATVSSLLLLLTVVAIYPIRVREYHIARWAVVFAGSAMALYGLYANATGQHYVHQNRLTIQLGKFNLDANHYAAFFAIPISIVLAAIFTTKSRTERFLLSVSLLAMLANVLLSGSRGGLIAVLLAAVYIGVRVRQYKLLGAMIGVTLLACLAIPNVLSRFTDSKFADASGRTDIWNVGFKALGHSWFAGVGLGGFPSAYNAYLNVSVQKMFTGFSRPAHNILMQSGVELGIIGVVLLLLAWWKTLTQNTHIPRGSPFFADRLAYEAAMIATFANALSIDLVWFKYLWLCLMMVALLSNVTRPRTLWGRQMTAPIVLPKRVSIARVRETVRP